MESVQNIKALFAQAREDQIPDLMKRYADDERRGVQAALQSAQKRLERERREQERLSGLYSFEQSLAGTRGGGIIVGIDEVGRGPLAGPLAAGAVVLDPAAKPIAGLNDSKKLTAAKREVVAEKVREQSLAWAVCYVEPQQIDEMGIARALRLAFTRALASIEEQGVKVDVVLLDGNPVGFDPREINVVKGDGKCASIAAASIIAKVERDHLMEQLDLEHPGYGFASNKGYGSEAHIHALRTLGLSTVHRKSFCTNILQDPLF